MRQQQPPACVDAGSWTAVPPALLPLPTRLPDFTLKFQEVDPLEAARITTVQTFHLLGCTGDFSDQQTETAVAQAMAAQVDDPNCAVLVPNSPATHASFLFHLGDVVYRDDNKKDPNGNNQTQMYNAQFYTPYTSYRRTINGQSDFSCIFAIAGNHDGKLSADPDESAITHFVTNWCATPVAPPPAASAVHPALIRPKAPDNQTDDRLAMVQPYVYWRLDTPLAYIIGLYTNIANGGVLDDPPTTTEPSQYCWLVDQLRDVGQKNTTNTPRKAAVLALHYPSYSGATNFAQRGDPTWDQHRAAALSPRWGWSSSRRSRRAGSGPTSSCRPTPISTSGSPTAMRHRAARPGRFPTSLWAAAAIARWNRWRPPAIPPPTRRRIICRPNR